ncbi:acetyl esterase [Pseudomassariella vexata]|uniref:Acetyl esterase n=1 Tax=Pseudomassariella vexata TaxID=1141098 RepID=A0A1Y2DS45_9PEZI|nr:acetyl esterase [Pseudomassariella vexata]ORY62098.1 acetyl esterase [Pseudomassariella vexata]
MTGPINIHKETHQANIALAEMTRNSPRLEDVRAPEFLLMQDAGKTTLPPPTLLPRAYDTSFPSQDVGRDIPVRVYKPDNSQASQGLIMHMHGGGFVLGSHRTSDYQLQLFANKCQLTALSVNYRHAPESPYPAPGNDCLDAAEFLLLFMTGESSGGNLTVTAALALMRSRPSHRLAGLIPYYGAFDPTLCLPQAATYTKPLGLSREAAQHLSNTYLPGLSMGERRNPAISPMYEDLQGLAKGSVMGKLPPALFQCGTEDIFLDDSILMCAKWQMTGSEGVLRGYPGAPHGFSFMGGKEAESVKETAVKFVKAKLAELRH